jgi:hypothetical protein
MTGQEPAGTLGEEAAKLLAALRGMFATGGAGALGREHLATGAPECTWCPLCQLIALLRGDRPEASEKLLEAGQAVVTALRTLVDASADWSPSTPTRHVERIDLEAD